MRQPCIYNRDGKLKRIFKEIDLPSGIRLSFERIGDRSYKLYPNLRPHSVRCKHLSFGEDHRLRIEAKNENVEWETDDLIFRHQLTFHEIEALYAEADRINLSVRDAVYKVMKNATPEGMAVSEVYETVFWNLRTCSLGAVWAEFRAEHTCYRRKKRVVYEFNPSAPPPGSRTTNLQAERPRGSEVTAITRQAQKGIRIVVHWSRIKGFENREDDAFEAETAGDTLAQFLGSLVKEYGKDPIKMPTIVRVCRLADNPSADPRYKCKRVPGVKLWVRTTISNERKRVDIRNLVRELRWSPDSVEVLPVPARTAAERMAAQIAPFVAND